MTSYLNSTTRSGGADHIVVAERPPTVEVEEAPFDDTQYVRINGEWVAVDVPPPVPDTLAPSPPTGLSDNATVVASEGAVDYEVSWVAPTTNTDATPLTDLAYYVVRWRHGIGMAYQSFVSNDTDFLLPRVALGVNVEWGVLARDYAGNDSTWATDTITGVTDVVGPDQPSTPSLSSKLGTIVATWNGLDSGGDPPPADFHRLEFYVSTTSTGPWTLVGEVSGTSPVVITNVAVGSTRYVSSIAFDTSGNASPRSAVAAITVLGITGPDIEANSVAANHIVAGSVDTVALTATAIDGMTITGALVQTDAAVDEGVKMTTAGLLGYNSIGVNTFELDAVTGELTALSATIAGIFRTATSGQRVEISTVAGRGGVHAIDFYPTTLHASMDPASIESSASGGVGSNTSLVKLRAGRKSDGSGPQADVTASTSGASLRAHNSTTGDDLTFILDSGGDARLLLPDTSSLLIVGGRGIDAASMRTQAFAGDGSTDTTTSTTGATMGASGAQGTFVAPASGEVEVTVMAQLKSSDAGQAAACSFEVRTGATIGSGTVVDAADIDKAAMCASTNAVRSSMSYLVTGLAAGNTYNIRTILISGVGTNTASGAWARLHVTPQP